MKGKVWMAWALSASLLIAGLSGFSSAVTAEETGDSLQEKSFQRVMDGQAGDLLHYHYEDSQGNTVEPQTTAETSSRKKAASASLPASYDPRGTEAETPIRDQLDTGACWTFGALKSLEGNAISQGLYSVEEADFSENHLAWYTYNRLKNTADPLYGDYVSLSSGGKPTSGAEIYSLGGNALFAMFILANGWGAAAESDAPFDTSETMAEAMEQQEESFRTASVMQLTSAECYDDAAQDEIKQEILANGAMDVALCYPTSSRDMKAYMYSDDEVCSLYNNTYTADDANHCVTIVGWDDDFNTFTNTPEQSGAWLIANSYGEEYNSDGYFWVSYYDTSLCEYYSYEGTSADTYTNAFQYDGFGWGDGFVSDQYIRLANVFTNETDEPQQITAASFYTYADGQSYEVNVYRNLGEDGPTDGDWVGRCTTEGTADYSGYHTVDLTEPIAVDAGETFSVVVTFYANIGKAYALVEGENDMFSGIHHTGDTAQSYVYFAEEGEWYDTVEERYNNVCVKAFANPVTETEYQEQQDTYQPSEPTEEPTLRPTATPLSTASAGDSAASGNTAAPAGSGQSSSADTDSAQTTSSAESAAAKSAKILKIQKVVMGKGEKLRLPVTAAFQKSSLTYRSSKTKVAKVSKHTGILKAKKTGTAKITVRSASGVKQTIRVRVKKAPKSLTLKAAKTKLKKGKSTKIKVKLSKGSASYRLRFRSMNPKIATVTSKGKVTAKKAGTVRIRVKTFNEKKAYLKIKVVS